MAKYRAIRRMAIQGADYEREQMAFEGGIHSDGAGPNTSRGIPPFGGSALHMSSSSIGRSIARPLGVWLVSAIAFAAIYFWNAGVRPARVAIAFTATEYRRH